MLELMRRINVLEGIRKIGKRRKWILSLGWKKEKYIIHPRRYSRRRMLNDGRWGLEKSLQGFSLEDTLLGNNKLNRKIYGG